MAQKSFILFLVLSLFVIAASAQRPAKTAGSNAELSAELVKMGKEDQLYRAELERLMKLMSGPNSGAVMKKFEAAAVKQDEIDAKNLARLEQIIEKHGWPGERLVGREASGAAFLIIQHSDLSHQKKYFPMLKAAADSRDARPQDVAMLEDRILVREGKKQIYGTQLSMNQQTHKLELDPIEEEGTVDERRSAVGLPPLAEYVKYFGLTYKPVKRN